LRRYVEAVKDRLYRPEVHGQAKKDAGNTHYMNALRVLQLLSPVAPHLTEEIYQAYTETRRASKFAVIAVASYNEAMLDEHAEKRGDLIIELIGEIRREKAEKHLPLNTQSRSYSLAKVILGAEAITEVKATLLAPAKLSAYRFA